MNNPAEQYNAVKNGILEVVENAAHYRDLIAYLMGTMHEFGFLVESHWEIGKSWRVTKSGVTVDSFYSEWEAYRFLLEQFLGKRASPVAGSVDTGVRSDDGQ